MASIAARGKLFDDYHSETFIGKTWRTVACSTLFSSAVSVNFCLRIISEGTSLVRRIEGFTSTVRRQLPWCSLTFLTLLTLPTLPTLPTFLTLITIHTSSYAAVPQRSVPQRSVTLKLQDIRFKIKD